VKTKRDPCKEMLRNMYLILEGERPESLCERLRSHLDHCPFCAERARGLEDLVSLCERFPREEISEDEKRRIKQNLLRCLVS
jgi:Putative zinc-finger